MQTLNQRPRLLVLTDIGGDPDDQQTLVRLLVHANEFDIHGIIPEHWRPGHKQTPEEQMALVRRTLRAYGQVRDTLRQHAPGYPTEAHLQSVLKRGKSNVPFALDRDTVRDVSHLVGPGMDTEGSSWIVDLIDRPDPDHAVLRMVCGKGGYVRAIARDLGRELGCLRHVLWP